MGTRLDDHRAQRTRRAEYSVSWPNLQNTVAKLAEALLPEAERAARRAAEAADREYREAFPKPHEMFPEEEESREEEETAHV